MKRKLFCLILAICCMASLLCGCSNFPLSSLIGLFGGSEKENEQQVPDIPSDEGVFEEGEIHIIIPSDGEEDESDKPNKVIIIRPSEEDEKVEKPDTPVSNKQESSKEEPKKEEKPTNNGGSYAPLDGMLGDWYFINSSGDGEDIFCQKWEFGGSSDLFWAKFTEGMLNSKGKMTQVHIEMFFDYGYFKDGKMYLACGSDEYGPYSVSLSGSKELLFISSDSYRPSSMETIYDCENRYIS